MLSRLSGQGDNLLIGSPATGLIELHERGDRAFSDDIPPMAELAIGNLENAGLRLLSFCQLPCCGNPTMR